MVLLILGVISYFASTPLLGGWISPVAEMELVKNHLRYAQSRTMNTEKDWGIYIRGWREKLFSFQRRQSGVAPKAARP